MECQPNQPNYCNQRPKRAVARKRSRELLQRDEFEFDWSGRATGSVKKPQKAKKQRSPRLRHKPPDPASPCDVKASDIAAVCDGAELDMMLGLGDADVDYENFSFDAVLALGAQPHVTQPVEPPSASAKEAFPCLGEPKPITPTKPTKPTEQPAAPRLDGSDHRFKTSVSSWGSEEYGDFKARLKVINRAMKRPTAPYAKTSTPKRATLNATIVAGKPVAMRGLRFNSNAITVLV